ncbi:MAG: hypothetical protein WCO45_16700, partial [Pseudanabaena sp. ELA607]
LNSAPDQANSSTSEVRELIINAEALAALKQRLQETMTIAIDGGIKNGVFHVTSAEGDTLMVAANLIQKEQIFPDYKLKFYRLGMGAGTNTSAVTFIKQESVSAVMDEARP